MNYILWLVLYFVECICLSMYWMLRWRSWLKHSATSRQVVGWISDGVTGIFHGHNPSCRIMTLGSILPLREMSSRSTVGRCEGPTTLPPSCADCLRKWESQLPATLWACDRPEQGLLTLNVRECTVWVIKEIFWLYLIFRKSGRWRELTIILHKKVVKCVNLIPYSHEVILSWWG